MPTTLTGTAITVGSIDLTTPLAKADGGTGSSTISPYQMVLGTAVPYTSFTTTTYHDFTGIPSWVKRITVMLNGISTNGTAFPRIQIGDSGGVEVTGYLSESVTIGAAVAVLHATAGFDNYSNAASVLLSGPVTLTVYEGNTWMFSGNLQQEGAIVNANSGKKVLSGALDRIRLTTSNGTDVFDAGSVNIMYEGY